QDANGNVYTYANLGSIPSQYPSPKPVPVTAGQIAKELSVVPAPNPAAPATAGSQQAPAVPSTKQATKATAKTSSPLPTTATNNSGNGTTNNSGGGSSGGGGGGGSNGGSNSGGNGGANESVPQAQVKERLFAYPSRPGSNVAGGALQLHNLSQHI